MKIVTMEKKMFGIILTVLGIAGLIAAAVIFMNSDSSQNIKKIVVYLILGAIFFFTGIGLIRTTKDRSV